MAEAKLKSYTTRELKLLLSAAEKSKTSQAAKNKNFRLGAIIAFGLRKLRSSEKFLIWTISKSSNPDEVAFAGEALLAMNPSTALPLIKDQLKSKKLSNDVKCYLTLCLTKHLDKELIASLKKQLKSRSVDIGLRRCSMIVLVMSHQSDAFQLVKDVITNKLENQLRYDAVRLLAFVPNKTKAKELLIKVLVFKTPEIRREAAFALGQINDPSTKKILYAHLMKEKEARALRGLAFAYSLQGTPSDKKELAKLLKKLYFKNVDSAITYFAAVGLSISGKEKEKSFKLYQSTYKSNRQYETRKGLILAMSLLNSEASATEVSKILLDRRNSDLRLYAAYGIGYMKRDTTILSLAQSSRDRDNLVRHAAVAAHGMFGAKILKYKPETKKQPPPRLPELKKIAEKDRTDVVRLGAAFSYDVLSGELENLKTVEILSQKNASTFPLRSITKRAILDKVNDFYPKYHKTFLGY